MKPGDRVTMRRDVTRAGTLTKVGPQAMLVRWDGEDLRPLNLAARAERLAYTLKARIDALPGLERFAAKLAVFVLAILLGGCLVIGYARLWYYWFEFVFTGHVLTAAGYLAWVTSPEPCDHESQYVVGEIFERLLCGEHS